jgi:cytoskeletal protein RodZ
MSSVAEQLHQAREGRRLSIAQVAEITKIRSDHIRALEEGNFDMFSAPVYIRGFVRTYSTLLKLDVPKVMASLEAELGATKKFSEPPPLTNRSRSVLDSVMLQLSRLDWRKAGTALGAITVLAAVVIGLVVWRHSRASDPLKNLKPGIYQGNTGHSGETLPLPPVKK